MKILDEFKAFIMKGNIFSLAIAVVIGLAFVSLVDSTNRSLISPLIGILMAGKGLQALNWHVTNNVTLAFGDFLSAAIEFLVTAAVVFFLFIKPMTKFGLMPSEEKKDVAPPPPPPPV